MRASYWCIFDPGRMAFWSILVFFGRKNASWIFTDFNRQWFRTNLKMCPVKWDLNLCLNEVLSWFDHSFDPWLVEFDHDYWYAFKWTVLIVEHHQAPPNKTYYQSTWITSSASPCTKCTTDTHIDEMKVYLTCTNGFFNWKYNGVGAWWCQM